MCPLFHLHPGFVLISLISSRTQFLVSSVLVKLHEFVCVLDSLLLLVKLQEFVCDLDSLLLLVDSLFPWERVGCNALLHLSCTCWDLLCVLTRQSVLEKAAEESVHSETFGGMFCGHLLSSFDP